ncbi:MAG: hypothetical protein EA406_13140 [Rhodospirillales bacterium]|nr:MAG: hypothetical protein EA406_13140 [Rhodospirillales bacterium]
MSLTQASDGPAPASVHLFEAAGAETISLPAEVSLFGAAFERSGHDLILAGPDGAMAVVRDFFMQATPPDLVDAAGGYFSGAFITKLAGPLAPAQWAQAADTPALQAIGTVDSLSGTATSTRIDGSVVALAAGDPVFADDVLSTGANGALGIVFIDGTVLSLGAGSRIVLDELVYDPGGGGGNLTFSVVEGVFVFVSGAIAKTGPDAMVIETPVASIGIRGTVFGLSYDAATGRLDSSLMSQFDPVTGAPIVGEIVVSVVAPDGTVLALETVNVIGSRITVADRALTTTPITVEDAAGQFAPAMTPTLGGTGLDPSYMPPGITPGDDRGNDRGDRGDANDGSQPLAADGIEAFLTEAGGVAPGRPAGDGPAAADAPPARDAEPAAVTDVMTGDVVPVTMASLLPTPPVPVAMGVPVADSPALTAARVTARESVFRDEFVALDPRNRLEPEPIVEVRRPEELVTDSRQAVDTTPAPPVDTTPPPPVDTTPAPPVDTTPAPPVDTTPPPPIDTTPVPPVDTTPVPPVDTTPAPPVDITPVPPVDTTPPPPVDTAPVPPVDPVVLIDDFESGRIDPNVWTAEGTVEVVERTFVSAGPGNRVEIDALQGNWMVRIDAGGQSGAGLNKVLNALGLAANDPVLVDADGSQPISGSALWQPLDVAAGDVISFRWAFDSRENNQAPFNDFALFVAGNEAFRLSDARSQPIQFGFTEGEFSYTASESGPLLIGFAAFNDGGNGQALGRRDSVLLVDDVRINDPAVSDPGGQGYTLVSGEESGPFQAWGQTVTAAAA